MLQKATEIDWLCPLEANGAWNEFSHLPPLNTLRSASSDKLLPLASPIREDALRVVAISDTHSGPLTTLNLPRGDVLIHAGDFTRTGSERQIATFNEDLGAVMDRYSKIIVIAGNHDIGLESTPTIRELFTNCHYLEDESISLCGITFYGSPWTPEFFKWAFMKKRGEELDKVWRAIPQETDVLITHGPPLGILDLCHSGDRSGCLALTWHVLKRIKPKFHVFGHIHERRGAVTYGPTTFINASICTLTYRPINAPFVFDVPLPNGRSKQELAY